MARGEVEAGPISELLLWKDETQYFRCAPVNWKNLNQIWTAKLTKNDAEPLRSPLSRIVRKSVLTINVKTHILKICGSEKVDLSQLLGLNWQFVRGEQPYRGRLDFPQQIAYLDLVL